MLWSITSVRADFSAPPDVVRVSVSSTGVQGNNTSFAQVISADGRFIAFVSASSNLVPNDTNGTEDVFVHDRQTGQTERVSVWPGNVQNGLWADAPAISADGNRIVFVWYNLTYAYIYLRDRQADTTVRVSKTASGSVPNANAYSPAISGDGRFVAFQSEASDLVANDTNGYDDVFVYDTLLDTTERVSVKTGGGQSSGGVGNAGLSHDGRFVIMSGWGYDLVPNDTNDIYDVFVHDRLTHVTQRVSVSSSGGQAVLGSWHPAISGNGRYAAFTTLDPFLIPNDTNATMDVYLRDLWTNKTERVSLSNSGTQVLGGGEEASLSYDGRFVAFQSPANRLVSDDTNGEVDVFVRDRLSQQTILLARNANGEQANSPSGSPKISADGRFVAFYSHANNLVPNDTNDWRDIFAVGVIFATPLTAAPAPGYFTTSSVTLTWNPVTWALGYQVQIALDSSFAGFSILSTDAVSGTTFNLPSFPDGVYYWRVRGKISEPDSWGAWSAPQRFEVAAG
jgi:Tol biopolymer transport system component